MEGMRVERGREREGGEGGCVWERGERRELNRYGERLRREREAGN